MTTFIITITIFLVLFIIGPKATKRKEERDRLEKELLEQQEVLEREMEEQAVDDKREVQGNKMKVNKKPKLKTKVFRVVSERRESENEHIEN